MQIISLIYIQTSSSKLTSTNEIYLLGDTNINLLQNEKFILKENQSYNFKNTSSALVKKYKEFCQHFH